MYLQIQIKPISTLLKRLMKILNTHFNTITGEIITRGTCIFLSKYKKSAALLNYKIAFQLKLNIVYVPYLLKKQHKFFQKRFLKKILLFVVYPSGTAYAGQNLR